MGQVSRPAQVVRPELPISQLEPLFWDKSLSSVLVIGDDPQRVGIVTRSHFYTSMSGRLGYGRAIAIRRKVSDITMWQPLVLAASTLISEAATAAMARQGQARYDDIVVSAELWCVASTADVTLSLVGNLAERSTHDQLTRLAGRAATWHELSRRVTRAANGRARIALVLLKVRGISGINEGFGESAGDEVLRNIAAALAANAPDAATVGRVGGRKFAVLVTLPSFDDAKVALEVNQLELALVGAVSRVQHAIPQQAWPTVAAGSAWSAGQGTARAEWLVRLAEQRVRRLSPSAD